MARVLLVKPSHAVGIPDVVPPMGLLYLAAVLRSASTHDVRILDARLASDPAAALRRTLVDFAPDIVGISAITLERRSLVAACSRVRAWNPEVPIMVGGPHATIRPLATLADTGADAVVVGEGEDLIVALVEGLLAKADVSGIAGVLTATTPPSDEPPQPVFVRDVDRLPFPAWELVDLAEYQRRPSLSPFGPWRYVAMVTSRGCPFACSFCGNVGGRRYRARSVESVEAELAYLLRTAGPVAVEILDDAVNVSVERAAGILGAFARLGGKLRPSFASGVRADRMDDTLLDLCQASHASHISFAIESGSRRIQEQIGKRVNLDVARQAIAGAARRGIYTNGLFMLGFPGETLAEMAETVGFALDVPLTQATFLKVLPLPGTRLWASCVSSRPELLPRLERQLDEATFFDSNINLSAVPDWQLDLAFSSAYLAFYSRPDQWIKLLRRYPGKRNLLRRGGWMAGAIARRAFASLA